MGQELEFTIFGHIDRSRREVFEAVADPEQLLQYYATKGARGWLETGATVWWEFDDYPGEFPVEVLEVVGEQRIVLRWSGDETADGVIVTTVTITFEVASSSRTKLSIHESGWPNTDDGRTAAFGNCEGWAGMIWALKAWIEHRINLRSGFYL